MSSVLIIGASGLLGQVLIDSFKQRVDKIGALSRKPKQYNDNSIEAHSIDVLNPTLLEAVIKEYDVIINCIGQVTFPITNCLLLNTTGITNIVNSIKKYNKRLIHISTVSVYGSSNYVDESSDLNPETPYGSIKCFAEYLIKLELNNYTILRVSNLFGDGQKKGIINYLTNSYLSNKKDINFNNDGSLKRYYLHIDDLANIIIKILMKDVSGTFNVVGMDQLTIAELVAMFESILGYKFNTTYANSLPVENIEVISCTKLNKLLQLEYKKRVQHYVENLKIMQD
jgi:nucleoside-diphosphate-sugar epimerase